VISSNLPRHENCDVDWIVKGRWTVTLAVDAQQKRSGKSRSVNIMGHTDARLADGQAVRPSLRIVVQLGAAAATCRVKER
jgi:hypothetical protein